MYDVFISYRRDGGHEMARLLYEHLKLRGINCFFDLEELGSGQFNTKLLDSIDQSNNFVVVLSPNSLERCKNEGDWVRCEIEHAIKQKKNIVPFMLTGFSWPDGLPESLAQLPFYNGVQLVREYFDASIDKLIEMLVGCEQKFPVNNKAEDAISPLLKRTIMFLEDGDFESAKEYCDKVLDKDPECAQAYVCKLMAELEIKKQEELVGCAEPFDGNANYQKAIRFADEKLRGELEGYIKLINERNLFARCEETYQKAKTVMKTATTGAYLEAAVYFASLGDYKDARELRAQCSENAKNAELEETYSKALAMMSEKTSKSYEYASKLFLSIKDYKNSKILAQSCMMFSKEQKKDEIYSSTLKAMKQAR